MNLDLTTLRDPDTYHRVLPNGLVVVYRKNNIPKDTIHMELFCGVGSIDEEEGQTGIAHFIEHLAFSGTESYGKGQFIRELQELGVSFATHANAYTTYDHTVYHFQINNTQEKRVKVLHILSEILGKMTFPESEIEIQRKVILEERRARLGRRQRIFTTMMETLFAGTPYEREIIGVEQDISRISKKQFQDFYHKWYRPDNAVLVVVGDVDPDLLFGEVENAFEDYVAPAERLSSHVSVPVRSPDKQLFIPIVDPETTSGEINIVRCLPPLATTTPEGRKRDLEIYYLMDILNRRYMLSMADADPGILALNASYQMSMNHVDLFVLSAGCRMGKENEALRLLLTNMKGVYREGVSAEELELSKSELLLRYERMLTEKDDFEHDVFVEDIHAWILRGDEVLSIGEKKKRMEDMQSSITTDDLFSLAQDLYREHETYLFVETDEHCMKEFSQVVSEKQVIPNANTLETERSFSPLIQGNGRVVSRVYDEALHGVHLDYDNGLRVFLKSTDFKKDTFECRIKLYGGAEFLSRERQVLENGFLTKVLTLGGTAQRSYEEISLALKSKHIGLSVKEGGSYFFRIAGQSSCKDARMLLETIQEVVMSPGFRARGLLRAREQAKEELYALHHKPKNRFHNRYQELLFSGSPSTYVPHEEEIDRLSDDEIVSWIRSLLVPANMEIRIVANLPLDDMELLVTETLGCIPAGALPEVLSTHHRTFSFPVGFHDECIYGEKENKAVTVMSMPGTFLLDEGTPYLDVASEILQNRLFDVIRETLGGTYGASVHHQSFQFLKGGSFEIYFTTEPTQLDKLVEAVDHELHSFLKKEITEDEFVRVMAPMLENHRTELTDNAYWLHIAGDHKIGIPYTTDVKYYELLQKLTLAEWRSHIEHYWRPDDRLRLTLLPE